MSKQIYQHLLESEEFRELWSDESSLETIVDFFRLHYITDDLEHEVTVAMECLDIGMKKLFLRLVYKDKV